MLWYLNFFECICTKLYPKCTRQLFSQWSVCCVSRKIISCSLKDNKNNPLLFLGPCSTLSFHPANVEKDRGWKCNLLSGCYQDRVLYFLSTRSCFNHRLLPVDWLLECCHDGRLALTLMVASVVAFGNILLPLCFCSGKAAPPSLSWISHYIPIRL